jgi:hypothetical protein
MLVEEKSKWKEASFGISHAVCTYKTKDFDMP